MGNIQEQTKPFLPYREPTPGPSLVSEGSSREGVRNIRTKIDEPFLPYRHDLTVRSRELRKGQTAAEKRLWSVLRKRGFYGLRFVRQKPIICYIIDFYCSELKLAIEVDGGIHDGRTVYDSERTIELEEYGITVIRYTNDKILNQLSYVLDDLSETIEALKQHRGDDEIRAL